MREAKKNKIAMLVGLGLGSLALVGCGEDAQNGSLAAATVKANVKSVANINPEQTYQTQLIITNASQANIGDGVASQCPAVALDKVELSTIKQGDIDAVVIHNTDPVGADGQCSDGTKYATLACGQSCAQTIEVKGSDKAYLSGNVDIQYQVMNPKLVAATSGQQSQLKAPLRFTTIEANNPPLIGSVKPTVFPNANVQFVLNNQSDYDYEGVAIVIGSDFSTAITRAISNVKNAEYSLSDGLIVGTIPAGETVIVSFDLSGSVAPQFSDPSFQAALANNNKNYFTITGVNIQEEKPAMRVFGQPYHLSTANITMVKPASVQLLPHLGALPVTIQNIDVSSLPYGVTLKPSSTCQIGAKVEGVAGCGLQLDVASDASTELGGLTIQYSSNGRDRYIDTLKVGVDNTTTLNNNESIVAMRMNENGTPRLSSFKITNNGNFDIQIPSDISQLLSISSSLSTEGLSLVNSCDKTVLKPNQSCNIQIKSDNPKTQLGNYQINVVGYQNVKPSHLASFSLQPSLADLEVAERTQIPAKIDEAKTANLIMDVTNTGGNAITLSQVTLPQGQGTFVGMNIGDSIAVGETRRVVYMLGKTSSDQVNGNIALSFNQGEFVWKSTQIDTQFVPYQALPKDSFLLNGDMTFKPSNDIEIHVKNTSNDRLHRLALDLSEMPEDLYAQLSDFDGGVKQGKTIVFEEDLLPSDTHSFGFTVSADAADALKANLNEILHNNNSHIVALTTVNTQSQYPSLDAEVTPLVFSTERVWFGEAGEVFVEVENATNAIFTLDVDGLPDEVAVTGCDTIEGNSTCTLTFSAANDAIKQSKTATYHIQDMLGQYAYTHDFEVSIGGTGLNKTRFEYVGLPVRLENGRPTITNVTLTNTGKFDLQPMNSLDEMFTIVHPMGMVPIEGNGLEIVEGTIGKSCMSGVPRYGQCVIGIQSNDPNMELREYIVIFNDVGNLVTTGTGSTKSFEFELTHHFINYQLDVMSPLPSYVIDGKEAHYQAKLTSWADGTFHIEDAVLPSGAVEFSDDVVGVDGSCWNGSEGAILSNGQSCHLNFTMTAGQAGTSFDGSFDLHVVDTVTHDIKDLRVTDFDVDIVDEQYAQDNAVVTMDAADFIFSPARDASLILKVQDGEVLNNIKLDLSAMPVALREQIYAIKVDGEVIEIDDSGVVSMGTLRAGSHQLVIEMATTSQNALKQYQDALEHNPSNQWIKLDAANMQTVAPVVLVSLAPLVQFDHQDLRFDQPNVPFRVEVVNDSKFAYNITGVHQQTALMKSLYATAADISVDDSNCVGALNANDSCYINVTASPSAHGAYHLEMEYSDSLGNDFVSPIEVAVSDTSAQLVVPKVVQRSDDGKTFNIQVQNNGKFDLQAITTIGNALSLSNYSAIELTGNGSCYQLSSLAVNQTCQAEVHIDDAAPLQDGVKISLQADQLSNLEHSITSQFDVKGESNLVMQMQDSHGNWDTVNTVPVRASNAALTTVRIVNMGDAEATLKHIDFDLNLISGLKQPILNDQNCSENRVLAPQDYCQLTLQGRSSDQPVEANASYEGDLVISYDDLTSHQQTVGLEYQIPYMFKSIQLGKTATGASRCGIDASNHLVCWGDNQYGQLGIGKVSNYEKSPQPVVVGERFDPSQVSVYSVGNNSICAASEYNGDALVSCWGRNDMGQSGHVTNNDLTCKAQGDEAVLCKPNPITENEGSSVFYFDAIDVSTNGGTSCIVMPGNKVACWGGLVSTAQPQYEYLNHTKIIDSSVYQVVVTERATFLDQSYIQDYADYAVIGMNNYDQYNIWYEARQTPHRKMIAAYADIVGMDDYANFCLIDDGGTLKCRGGNAHGELGINSTEEVYGGDYYQPLSVNGFDAQNVKKVAVGAAYMCALDDSSTLYCWGDNSNGQLGLGTDVAFSSVAQPVVNANGFVNGDVIDFAVGAITTCAITSDYQLYCWGKSPLESADANVSATSNKPLPVQRPQ